ncbi:Glycosyltransferase involved in cell wall bisynthesis [Enhydrobacter aerosaccus]|uniref:Glycosyltransferase involved in cell wall bisynthesis n=2 Tax=Enhydrobacter aerosaccus TaxID=225324 RepID=A0A1T4SC18_9HYPH|nr:Glycosyltransferase involved in cell wall bisynthesis [Enhydrobacter aerosaccus]
MKQKKIAIICSYNESCGNASYAHVLKMQFSKYMQCDVIPLDLFLLQKSSPQFSIAADRHIRRIAAQIADYDYVNIQLEAGLFGATHSQVLHRMKILLAACRNVVVTMHRIDPPAFHVSQIMFQFWESIAAGHPIIATRRLLDEVFLRRPAEKLYKRLIEYCRRRARHANVWIMVHTKRERRLVQEIYEFDRVVDFPITFLTEDQRQEVLVNSDPGEFRRRHGIDTGVKVIGAFGFISSYKGYETLIKALKFLPEEYHLYIFGGQHPSSVAQGVPFDPYIESLIELIGDENMETVSDLRRRLIPYVRGRTAPESENRKLVGELEAALSQSLKFDLGKRVHFVGELSDPHFIEALRASDAVVLPYLEVGQSMSGVIALAIESGANLLCARNRSFAEVTKYYGETFTSFDIGNYVELAQKIQRGENRYQAARDHALAKYNLKANVALHLEKLGFVPDEAGAGAEARSEGVLERVR